MFYDSDHFLDQRAMDERELWLGLELGFFAGVRALHQSSSG